jgi:hypothetical protein
MAAKREGFGEGIARTPSEPPSMTEKVRYMALRIEGEDAPLRKRRHYGF